MWFPLKTNQKDVTDLTRILELEAEVTRIKKLNIKLSKALAHEMGSNFGLSNVTQDLNEKLDTIGELFTLCQYVNSKEWEQINKILENKNP